MADRSEHEGFQILEDFVCGALQDPALPKGDPGQPGQNAGVQVLQELVFDSASANGEPALNALRSAVQQACCPQNAGRIVEGRQQVLAMPRPWVLECIGLIAEEALDLTDYWEYRRLLELLALLDSGLLQRFVARGLTSTDAEVRETAEDFRR